ncbi:bifunctional folylpolyglutamate synthase/dihydrofolate synthase [Shouchella clausii]|nr:bifunctional folylpolyglutamate synthase/dihydrofolate synthase [Shouchella clausii]
MEVKTAEEAVQWVHSLLPFGIKPGLKRMEWMLEALGHPEQKLTAVHVAGTNGKGSTVSFLRHILTADGFSVGTFTSPYIEQFSERISVNGVPISDHDLLQAAKRLKPIVEEVAHSDLGSPTEFEVLTAMMFYHFAEVAKPDICLIEVGLGGRLDSTNVVMPVLSIITMIGHDHMHILGDTLAEIAYEKAGIIKPGVPVISGVEGEEAYTVISETARQIGSPLHQLNETFFVESLQGRTFTYKEEKGEEAVRYHAGLYGAHQHKNAALALKAVSLLSNSLKRQIGKEAKAIGIANTSWPGRFEIIQVNPPIVLDGAHNEEGFLALTTALQERFSDKNIHVLLASTKEKDMNVLLKPFTTSGLEVAFSFTSFDFHRAANAEDLFKQAPVKRKQVAADWRIALKTMMENLGEQDVLVVTGSLYFISEVRQSLASHKEGM